MPKLPTSYHIYTDRSCTRSCNRRVRGAPFRYSRSAVYRATCGNLPTRALPVMRSCWELIEHPTLTHTVSISSNNETFTRHSMLASWNNTNSCRTLHGIQFRSHQTWWSWGVKEVIDRPTLGKQNKIQYCLLWEWYRSTEGTWEACKRLKANSENAVIEFYRRHPRKPKVRYVQMWF